MVHYVITNQSLHSSVIMGNIRCFYQKLEELTRLQTEYRECSIRETWLNEVTVDSLVTLDGVRLVRADS